ncbi:hypothetical protein Btru_011152 [Bulinus truncatus]|nr:hypothetical protein Btru_011152 [Bulinus truncatus]
MPPKLNLLPPVTDGFTQFPINRRPLLNVPIIKREPEDRREVHQNEERDVKRNMDESLPLPIIPEKTMFNIWEQTKTQTEVKWSKPENAGNFNTVYYEIQIREGDNDWTDLAVNSFPLYRIYYAEGKAIFGRTKISQDGRTNWIRLRIRPVGIIAAQKNEDRKYGPWSENILFSIEPKTCN